MGTITDFDSWLDQADPEGHEEVYALYRCIVGEDEFGMYECGNNNGRLFVKADSAEDTLMLASEKAKDAFLQVLRRRYVDDEDMDIESWYGYKRAMAKND